MSPLPIRRRARVVPRWLPAVAFAAFASGCASHADTAAPGPPKVVIRAPAAYHFYPVTGADLGSVTRSMHEAAVRTLGTNRQGRTNWQVTWRATWTQAGATCRVGQMDVQLQVDVFLPEWHPQPDAAPSLVADWQAFVAALSVHEAGHVGNAAAAANAVRRAVREFSAPGCIGMESRMRAEVDRILDEYRERDRRYDETTRHGATQGAVWPRNGTGHVPYHPSTPDPSRAQAR